MPTANRTHRLILVAALLGWCCTLVLFRVARTHTPGFTFLLWNLFLAVLPLVASAGVQSSRRRLARYVWFVVWLLFLPNAPYILTDVIHMSPVDSTLGWYDLAMLLFSAGTGLLLCYISLADVQAVIEARRGKRTGWLAAVWVLLLCGFGVYMGRFLHFNSWQAFTDPLAVGETVVKLALDSGDLPNPIIVSSLFGFSLTLGYLGLGGVGRPELSSFER